jgi:MerR family transcriptional regulator, light-induced transcriptional regulator
MGNPDGPSDYSIASVSKLTGISCHALRVWERRYGFPVPRRSPSGHRRYGVEQVSILRAVAERLRRGDTIGTILSLHRSGKLPNEEAVADSAPPSVGEASMLVDRLVAGDLIGAEAHYRTIAEKWVMVDLISNLLEPALIESGERWFRGEGDIYQEHCATGFLRRKLSEIYDAAQRANAHPHHTALVGTVQGDRHEGGVLILCALLEMAGWRAIDLGVDLPVREYQRAVIRCAPDALGLSFVLSRNINKRFKELSQIQGAPIFVGGRSILNYQRLARKYGLTPVPGPGTAAVPMMIHLAAQWAEERGSRSSR